VSQRRPRRLAKSSLCGLIIARGGQKVSRSILPCNTREKQNWKMLKQTLQLTAYLVVALAWVIFIKLGMPIRIMHVDWPLLFPSDLKSHIVSKVQELLTVSARLLAHLSVIIGLILCSVSGRHQKESKKSLVAYVESFMILLDVMILTYNVTMHLTCSGW